MGGGGGGQGATGTSPPEQIDEIKKTFPQTHGLTPLQLIIESIHQNVQANLVPVWRDM